MGQGRIETLTGATATAVAQGGVVIGITVTNLWSGYTTAPRVAIAAFDFVQFGVIRAEPANLNTRD